jgi:3-hydroxybutyryl-CoA dehydratase
MVFSDFVVGYKGSYTKKVTERDNDLFADLSGDYNPIHFEDELARSYGFKGRISNGFVTESRIAAALVETFGTENTLVVAIEKNTRFLKPVYMNDDITANVEVVKRIEALNILNIKARCFNQHQEKVVETSMVIKILPRAEALKDANK